MDYIKEANVTLSTEYHGDKVPLIYLRRTLLECIAALNKLDGIKKALFYGRDAIVDPVVITKGCNDLPHLISHDRRQGEVILHGIVGKATESGELLELLYNTLFESIPFDLVNCGEEMGDGFWYDAALCHVLGFTFEELQRINIAKLRARFKDKFDACEANNRRLANERRILDEGIKK